MAQGSIATNPAKPTNKLSRAQQAQQAMHRTLRKVSHLRQAQAELHALRLHLLYRLKE